MTGEPQNTPLLAGWAIAFGIGVVGGAVSYVALGLGANGSVLIGAVLLLVVGVILGIPAGSIASAAPAAAPAHAPVAPAAAAPATPPAAPVAAPAAPVAAPAAAAPVPAPAPVAAQEKPPALAAARAGKPDDLKLIKGVGPKLEAMLHGMGVFHFDQIAAWKAGELAWVDENLEGFKGRASRDEWVAQARTLAAGGSTDVSRRHEHD